MLVGLRKVRVTDIESDIDASQLDLWLNLNSLNTKLSLAIAGTIVPCLHMIDY